MIVGHSRFIASRTSAPAPPGGARGLSLSASVEEKAAELLLGPPAGPTPDPPCVRLAEMTPELPLPPHSTVLRRGRWGRQAEACVMLA